MLEMTIGPPDGSDLWKQVYSVEEMDRQGKTVSYRNLLSLCKFAFNYYRPPLDDVNFRHALVHLVHKERMISVLSPKAVAANGPVTPSQALWYDPFVDSHPYSPTMAESILNASGYHKVDGIWKMPDGSNIPTLRVYSPLASVTPTSYRIAEMFVAEAHAIGLDNVAHMPLDLAIYIDRVFNYWDYEIAWLGLKTSMFPSYLIDWFGAPVYCCFGNHHGIYYPELDQQLDILTSNVDNPSRVIAAMKAQELIMGGTVTNPLPMYVPSSDSRRQAIPMAPVYFPVSYDAQHPDLRGAVNMFGEGIGNMWTWMNLHWNTADGNRPRTIEKTIVAILEDYPVRLNPLHEWPTTSGWTLMNRVYDGLLALNPYTHNDEPWLATSWSYAPVQDGMDITSNLRLIDSQGEPVTWQDGKPASVNDVKFSWDFLHNWRIPNFWNSFKFYDPDSTVIIDDDTIRARITSTNHLLAYDLAATAYLLPPQVWTVDPRDGSPWASTSEILALDPSALSYPLPGNMNPGPIALPTQTFGTGPYILQCSAASITANGYGDLAANRNYWMTTQGITDKIEYMFWRAGDIIDNDVIDIADLAAAGYWFNQAVPPAPNQADIVGPGASLPDGEVDIDDLATVAKHFGEIETVPYEYTEP
jgi:ABC-type transport system substrate-binding protein